MYRFFTYFLLFLCTALFQIFLFDNVSVSIYLNPLVYVAFIVLLPLDIAPVVLLGAGLAMGAAMDATMGAAGINTIATLLIAFARPAILAVLYRRDDLREGACLRPSGSDIGYSSITSSFWSSCTMSSSSRWRPFRGIMCCAPWCGSSPAAPCRWPACG